MMMGTFERSVDDKGRVVVPVPLRKEITSQSVVLLKGVDAILVYSMDVFGRTIREPSFPEQDRFSWLANARTEKIDKTGRMRIRFLPRAKRVVLIGQDDHFQINPSRS